MSKKSIEDELRKRIGVLEEMLANKISKQRKGKKLRDIAADLGFEVGCGDNSCYWGSPGGMGTNGGCRCFERGVHSQEYIQLKQEFLKMQRVAQGLLHTLSEQE